MYKSTIASILVVLTLAHPVLAAQDSDDSSNITVAIDNATVIDVVNGKAIVGQSIVFQNDQIQFVGTADSIPENLNVTKRIDANGKFAIPGLWDMHVHAFGPNEMQLFPINGVAGVRLMWGMYHHHSWRKQFDTGEKLGPRMMIASAIIDGPNPVWPGSIIAKDKDSGTEAVAKAIAAKSDFAKVYSLLPRDAYFAIAEKCKQENFPFDGHVPRMVSPAEASDAGQRSMEHMLEMILACSSREDELRGIMTEFVEANGGSVRSLGGIRSLVGQQAPSIMRRAYDSYDEKKATKLFAILKKNETWQCPTLTVIRNLAHLTDPEIQNNPNLKYVASNLRTIVAPKKRHRPQSEASIKFEQEQYKKNLFLLNKMQKSGVPIIAGADVLNPFCLPGFSLHEELQLMVKAGFSPIDALRTATINAAKFQKKTATMGSIEAGKVADLVLLNANPLEDIRNTTKIDTVITRGKILNRKQLDELLSECEN